MAPYILKGPDGQGLDPKKTFLIDGYGNALTADDKDFALPTYMSVSSIISGANKTYLAGSFDEALKHSYTNSRAMYRDCRIMSWLEERIESVVNLKWHLEVEDEKDPAQKCVKDGLTIAMRRIPRFKRILRALMKWGLWGGRGVSELCWRWQEMDLPTVPKTNIFEELATGAMGVNNYEFGNNGDMPKDEPKEGDDAPGASTGPPQESTEPVFPKATRPVLMPFKNRPVNGDKINYLHGYSPQGAPPGTPLVRVHGAAGLDLPGAEIVYDNISPMVALTGEWRERFLIHIYDPDDADYFAPEMAGGIYGVGIRSRIYWVNWIRMEYASWIQDLYDRVGLGFVCIKYDMASTRAKTEAERAAKQWNRRSVLAIPVSTDQLLKAGSIEVVEVPTSGGVLVQELVKYLDKMIERYILRQTISGGSGSQGDGMRGTVGPADMAKNTETNRIKADAEELAETLTGSDDEPGLVSIMLKWTYPAVKFPVKFVFDIQDESPKEQLQAITIASGLGVEFGEDYVRGITGAPKPEPGQKIVGGKKQGMGGMESDAGGGGSASAKAAQEWIAEGKPDGKLPELAEKYGITRQAIGQEAKRIEGGGPGSQKSLTSSPKPKGDSLK
jgi:hypothetical protein